VTTGDAITHLMWSASPSLTYTWVNPLIREWGSWVIRKKNITRLHGHHLFGQSSLPGHHLNDDQPCRCLKRIRSDGDQSERYDVMWCVRSDLILCMCTMQVDDRIRRLLLPLHIFGSGMQHPAHNETTTTSSTTESGIRH
jgi:hypothetical protein